MEHQTIPKIIENSLLNLTKNTTFQINNFIYLFQLNNLELTQNVSMQLYFTREVLGSKQKDPKGEI